jgi:DNA-binding MarR family transcriptional regulator/GNAT superfamily N-acetyltransferase
MDDRQIQQVRRFNRLIIRRVGALDHDYLKRGRPLGEARLIYEVGTAGAEVGALRARLGLDSGYMSRLLRSLEAQNLVRVRKAPDDGRRRRVDLTAKGRAELATYDRLSNRLAQSMLSPLGAAGRERLIAAMAEVERLIRAAAIEVRIEAPTGADARWCLDQYFRELAARFEAGFDPAKSNPASDADMMPPAGVFVVARLDGAAVGCGALRRIDRTTGEVKRMWTAPAARGCGVAREVLLTLEATARSWRLTTLRLETNRTLVEAQALYRAQGYREVAAFNDEPYAHHWFAKSL